ncbi:PAS domain S-box protein [Maridesulfovibrio frigidus]|uniref:PAS domain S-box protein n=1 Tax=Maridesulfovibrio frigidus TaxID=340956 RepID=UPI0004E15F35|nr:PAS domain S-box protein [Maridesulfovibrio frigidus]
MKIRSIHKLNEQIRNYLCSFLTVFITSLLFSLMLFFWMIDKDINERTDTWSSYFATRIEFIESIIHSKYPLNHGIITMIRINPDGRIINSRPHLANEENISKTPLYKSIHKFKPGQIGLIKNGDENGDHRETLYMVKRLDSSFVIAELSSETLLPVIPHKTELFIFDKNNNCIFHTADTYKLRKDKIRMIMFSSMRIFASSKIKVYKAGSFTVSAVKNISAEFYGATLFMLLALAAVVAILKRSNRLTWDLAGTEDDFIRIKKLLANVSMMPGKKLKHLPAIEYAAEKIRQVDWKAEADKMSFMENKEYILTTSFFAGNILQLLDEISAHSNKLAASRHEYRDLVQRAHSIILRIDLDGRCSFFNEYAESFFGFSQEEIVGKKIVGTLIQKTENGNSKLEKMIKDITAYPEINQVSTNQNIRKNGSLVWVHWTNSPVYDENGHTVEVLSIGTDITERKMVEEELFRTKNYIRNIIDSMPSVIIGVNSSGEIVHFNSKAEDSSIIPSNELLGKKVSTAFPLLKKYSARIYKAIETEVPEIEIRAQLPSAEQQFQDIMIYPLTGDVKGAVIRIDDATERARIEDIMIQTEKMMSVGGLAAGMAHEINNPLGGILQGIQNIVRRFSPDLDSNRKAAKKVGCDIDSVLAYVEERKILQTIDGITESGVRAAEIVSRMLEFSRKSDSSKTLNDIKTLMDKSIDLATQDYNPNKKYDFKQITINKSYADNLSSALCSATEIEQVFLNLLRNSAQAMYDWAEMKDHPKIDISIKNLGEIIKCTVSDNGPGMTKDIRKRAFEPFYTTKDPGYGTGLGLSVSYFIITQNHKGSLSVESSPERGTTFTIMIPAVSS